MNELFNDYIDQILADEENAEMLREEIYDMLNNLYNKCLKEGLSEKEAVENTFKYFGANYTVGHLLRLHEIKTNYKELVGKADVRIKRGILAIIIVPIIFLALMFTLDQKIVFLILWVGFIIGIASYLILIEYRKYLYEKEIEKWEDIDEKYI